MPDPITALTKPVIKQIGGKNKQQNKQKQNFHYNNKIPKFKST